VRKHEHNYRAARTSRREMSLPEVLLWRELRRRAGGFKFRRQHPVGRYTLDFYCAEAKLGIEVDGSVHDMGDRPQRDETRTAFIAAQGIELLRVPAVEVLKSATESAEAIIAVCRERCARPLHPRLRRRSPSPLRRNGEDSFA
jgi:very-short-patch-repair endonuclease